MTLLRQDFKFGLTANIFLAKRELTPIICHKKTRQGYTRKRTLKLAGYFFLGGSF
jgi:thioredoxin reductase